MNEERIRKRLCFLSNCFLRRKVLLLSLLAICLIGVKATFAQTHAVSGKITDEAGEAMPGVTVIIKGTANGTVTNIDGIYSIDLPDANNSLVFSFVGMATQEIEVNGKSVINVTMKAESFGVDEVVVTALGIKREKKALGYAVQEVKGEALSTARTDNVVNSLSGRVAGVQINQNSTGVGGSTRMVIRGNGSLSDNNRPLWIVDGVPLDDSQRFNGGKFGGYDIASGASDLNPDDIESISVLKGPNAAALYGSRAGNGVIVVTTKRGAKDLKVSFNSVTTLTTISDTYDRQYEYGQGAGGNYDETSGDSWGPKFDGRSVTNWKTGQSEPYQASTNDFFKDFYRVGSNFTNSVAVQGGNELVRSRMSVTNTDMKGITPSHEVKKKSVDLNTTITKGKLELNGKISYFRTEGKYRPSTGSITGNLSRMPANLKLSDMVEAVDEDGLELQPGGAFALTGNPYYTVDYMHDNQDSRDRFFTVFDGSFKINDWLSAKAKFGRDSYVEKREIKTPVTRNAESQYQVWNINFSEVNVEGLLSANNKFGDFTSSVNIGANLMNRKSDQYKSAAKNLIVKDFFSLSNGSVLDFNRSISEKEIQSVFGFAQLGYKDYLYLDVTARNDWSSTLPEENRSYFYPSLNMSLLAHDFLEDMGAELPNWVSFLKFRGSWAQVGTDTDAYALQNTFGMSKFARGLTIATIPLTVPNSKLKPEINTSYEFGTDIKLFNNRFGIDFSMYKSNTKNQVLKLSVAPSTGNNDMRINAGEVENKGVELMVYGTPVKKNDFTWDVVLNFAKNENKIVTLIQDEEGNEIIPYYTHGGSDRMSQVRSYPGEKFGNIYGYAYKRDAAGNILVTEDGLPLRASDQLIGNIMPDWTGSITNDFSYKNWTLSTLIDIRKGGDIVSESDSEAAAKGTAMRTLEGREDGILIDGIVEATGQPNTKTVTAEAFWRQVSGMYGWGEIFRYDAGFVKLRQVAIGYNLPKKLLKNTFINSAKFSLVGHNLFYLYKDTPGVSPEGGYSSRVNEQGKENFSLPDTRSFGVNINLTF